MVIRVGRWPIAAHVCRNRRYSWVLLVIRETNRTVQSYVWDSEGTVETLVEVDVDIEIEEVCTTGSYMPAFGPRLLAWGDDNGALSSTFNQTNINYLLRITGL